MIITSGGKLNNKGSWPAVSLTWNKQPWGALRVVESIAAPPAVIPFSVLKVHVGCGCAYCPGVLKRICEIKNTTTSVIEFNANAAVAKTPVSPWLVRARWLHDSKGILLDVASKSARLLKRSHSHTEFE